MQCGWLYVCVCVVYEHCLTGYDELQDLKAVHGQPATDLMKCSCLIGQATLTSTIEIEIPRACTVIYIYCMCVCVSIKMCDTLLRAIAIYCVGVSECSGTA